MPNKRDVAVDLMEQHRYSEALPFLLELIKNNTDQSDCHLYYMTGQCFRFTNKYSNALTHLRHTLSLNPNDPKILIALGIAYQLNEDYDNAIKILKQAIHLYPGFWQAHNSLGLIYRKIGEFQKALQNYDLAVKALTYQIVISMKNNRNSPIIKHRDTVGQLWIKYAMHTGLFIATKADGIYGVAFPTGEFTTEERTENHAGLYWIDTPNTKNETIRLLLPNYFNTFRELLKKNNDYSTNYGKFWYGP